MVKTDMDYVLLEKEKSEQDIVAEKTEEIFYDLCNKNASLFTVGELIWLQDLANRTFFRINLKYQTKLFEEFDDFLKEIEEREKTQ